MTGIPTFSVLTTVFDPLPAHLRQCLRSVWSATTEVEHIVVDDASTDAAVGQVLTSVGPGVRLIRRAANGGICAATVDALTAAGNDWVVFLDHDDVLANGALDHLAAYIAAHPGAAAVYTDHDIIRPDGRRAEPVFKPDFSPERLRQTNYITHLLAVRRDVALQVGGIRPGFDGAQDHDLLLRISAAGLPIEHFAEVMYHWRQSPASVAHDPAAKPYAFAAGIRAVGDHLTTAGIDATVGPTEYPGVYRIHRRSRTSPLVSVVIPTRGSRSRVWGRTRTFVVEAIRSIVERSTYQHVEFVVVADPGTPAEVGQAVERLDARVRIVDGVGEFNFSARINAGAATATGELLLLLNDDTELVDPASIAEMVALLNDPPGAAYGEVGAVGARLLFDDGTLQHGGHVYTGHPTHACLGWRGHSPGPQRMLAVTREVSGVTAAALLTSRAVFDEVGGFPTELPLHFNDVAFCLAIRDTGRRILYTPYAEWYHFEGRTRRRQPEQGEWEWINQRWHDTLHADPYHNRHLVPGRHDWLERAGQSGAPPYYVDDAGRRQWA